MCVKSEQFAALFLYNNCIVVTIFFKYVIALVIKNFDDRYIIRKILFI